MYIKKKDTKNYQENKYYTQPTVSNRNTPNSDQPLKDNIYPIVNHSWTNSRTTKDKSKDYNTSGVSGESQIDNITNSYSSSVTITRSSQRAALAIMESNPPALNPPKAIHSNLSSRLGILKTESLSKMPSKLRYLPNRQINGPHTILGGEQTTNKGRKVPTLPNHRPTGNWRNTLNEYMKVLYASSFLMTGKSTTPSQSAPTLYWPFPSLKSQYLYRDAQLCSTNTLEATISNGAQVYTRLTGDDITTVTGKAWKLRWLHIDNDSHDSHSFRI